MFSDALPTGAFLFRRKISNDSFCPLGCDVLEDINHISSNCCKIRKVLSVLRNWGFLVPVFIGWEECLTDLQRLIDASERKSSERKSGISNFLFRRFLRLVAVLSGNLPAVRRSGGALMDQRRLLPSDVWKNCKKNLVTPVLDSSEIFNGGSKVLEGFNQNFKGFNGKPLVINEGGLLGRSELPVLVSGKGKNVTREEDLSFLKGTPFLDGKIKGIGVWCLECSSLADLKVSSCKNFDSKSFTSSPIRRDFYDNDLVNNNLRKANIVNEDLSLKEDVIIPEIISKAAHLDVESEAITGNTVRIPFHVISTDLRRQCDKFGKFHITGLGLGWTLCSFEELAAVEQVLSGGPWWIRDQVVGLDKWSVNFNPMSFNGISSPIWIRLPNLPLQCWDEINICRIASKVGKPYLLDGNSFQWSRREYARVCVRISLDMKLTHGVWVEGLTGKFFQKNEYEGISKICAGCEKIGHDLIACVEPKKKMGFEKNIIQKDMANDWGLLSTVTEAIVGDSVDKEIWTIVKSRKKSFNKFQNNKNFPTRKNSVPMKKVFVPKVITSDKENLNILAVKEDGVNLDVVRENSLQMGIDVKLDIGDDTPVEVISLDANQGLANVVSHAVEINNKFGALSELEEGGSLKSFAEIDKGLLEEGEILDSVVDGYLNKEVRFEEQSPRASRKIDIGKHHSDSKMEGSLSIDKKTKLIKELKSLGADNNQILKLLGSKWNFFMVPTGGLSGGLLILWRKDLAVFSVLEASSQLVVGKLEVIEKRSWIVASVYGSTDSQERKLLWESLEKHCSVDLPMVVGGDFNCILSQDEKRSGRKFSMSQDIRYEEVWASYHGAIALVRKIWNRKSVGNPASSREKHRNLNELRDKLKREILEIQLEESEKGISVENLQLLRFKINELNVTLARLNAWWKQRAKVRWIEEGDCNSSFFHAFANARRNSNWIHHTKNMDGVISEEESVIQKTFSNFFKLKWQHRVFSLDGWPDPSNTISKDDQCMLDADFTREELQLVVDNSERNISPGLDGITFSFMKDFWNVIKDDVWAAVFQFLSSCVMEQPWKETLIVLIPKIKCPQEPSHFWPISLCMTIYKVIAKMLLNRLEKVIHKLISVDQVAFVRGHSLSDHVLVAQEVFNKFRWSKSKGGLLAIKLDMEQAYDSMGWDSLRQVLIHFKFPPKFMELLLHCVLNPKFCILINGKKTDWIDGKISRGISVSRLAHRVSHLLFADDILIFSEAKVKEVKELRRIIKNYCDWTGYKVNYSKSMILFRKHTRKRVQKKIIKLFNFKQVKEFSYLGIKMALRRLRPSDFQNHLDSAAGRLNTWGSKNISLEEDSYGAKGMVMLVFTTFLGVCFILRAKYGEDIWSSSVKTGCSPAWKIITLGAKFLKNVVRWRISNGDSINWMYDSWILDICIAKWLTFVNVQNFSEFSLSSFISNGQWNFDKLKEVFGDHLIEIISSIPIDDSSLTDCMVGLQRLLGKNALVANMFCTVVWLVWKSKCRLVHGDKEDSENYIAQMLSLHWHPPPPGWIKINVDAAIKKNNVAGIGGVARDGNGRFLIALSYQLLHWDSAQSEMLAVLYLRNVIQDWMFEAQGVIIEGDNFNIINILQRNRIKQGNLEESNVFITTSILSFISQDCVHLIQSNNWVVNQSNGLSFDKWQPPPPDWIKINLDASLMGNYEAGIGGIVRDWRGRFLLAFGIKKTHWDIAQLEWSAVEALTGVLDGRFDDVDGIIVEGDNKMLLIFFIKCTVYRRIWTGKWRLKILLFFIRLIM
ncbi:hypothetical protein KFK09_017681 [Dendrobium nobile]|uniref:Reverse transcriptase n=1 Tax=Dendrobium nobile TaxID=94219 RepID=A0A8T3ATN8_DENNO|nr:hypothetical protein KFK09_017681 [Dendrobium nobile]